MKNLIYSFIIILLSTICKENSVAQTIISYDDSTKIKAQLYSFFDQEYEISNILNVQIAANEFNNFKHSRINNPYYLLDNCLVFTANTIDYNIRNSLLGIYKNNQIIWYSEFIIPYEVQGGEIYAIADITNNGKVEIVTKWEISGINRSHSILWIHSWNGIEGSNSLIVKDGESPIVSSFGAGFNFIDYEGDGVWEIVAHEVVDNFTHSFLEVFSWNGVGYEASDFIQLESLELFFPKNKFSANISARVRSLDDSNNNLQFNYSVANSESSTQFINIINIEGGMDTIFNVISPEGWEYWSFGQDIYWQDSTKNNGFKMLYNIKPGQLLSTFSYVTDGLPIISEAYLRGFNFNGYLGNEDITASDDYSNNSIILNTISAKIPLSLFDMNESLDSLRKFNNHSFYLGWIKNQPTYDKYNTFLTNSKSALEQNDTISARIYLEEVISNTIIDSATTLTSEAFALLYFNTEYLLDQLPQTNIGDMFNILINHINKCYEQKWIDNKGIFNSLIKKVENAKKQYEKGKIKNSKNKLKALNNELNAQKGKHLNDLCYDLLFNYSNNIIEKLNW